MEARLDAPPVLGGASANLVSRMWEALGRPWVPFVFVLLGTALVMPSLSVGLGSDDYVMLSEDRPGATIRELSLGAWDHAVAVPRDPAATRALIERGVFPWWTDTRIRLVNLRPLASLTHTVDHALLPGRYALWHLHSVLWFGLALLGAALFFRQLLGPGPVASLAMLFFSLDAAHGPTVGWLTTRHTIMALAFSALALWAYLRWRKEGWRAGRVLGPALFAVALLCNEIALGTCAYLAAHALFLERGPVRERLIRLSGFTAVFLVWAAAYAALGYGAAFTSQYVGPLQQPGLFGQQVVARAPVLLVAQLFVPWSNLWPIYPTLHPALPYLVWGYAVLALAAIAAISWPRLKEDGVARFAAAGMVVAVVPGCAGVTQDRLLSLVGLGAMALAASVVAGFVEGGARLSGIRRLATRMAVTMIVMVHAVSGLYWLPVRSRSSAFFTRVFEQANRSVPMNEEVRHQTVVLVNPPLEPLASYMMFERDALDEPMPARLRVLATGASSVAVERVDVRTVRVIPEKGFLSSAADSMLRSPEHPLQIGEVVALPDVSVEVTRLTPDRRVAEALFRFKAPLEDGSLTWLRWGERGYEEFNPPSVGESVTLAAVDMVGLFVRKPSAPATASAGTAVSARR